MSSKTNLEKNGAGQAAILAAMLGMLALSLVNLGTEVSETFKIQVHDLGKLWMPGAQGIGPYSGKETIALVAWLGSWFLLHRILRATEWPSRAVLIFFLAGAGISTSLLWPPIFNYLTHR